MHTFCRYCLASCGIEVTVEDNRVTKISADKQNPHSWQDFCAKGRTANQLVEHPRRILNPMRRVGDAYVEATWDEAITDIAARMNALIDADGPDAVGVYYGNPSGFSSSNIIFMNGWLDAVGTHSRYFVGSVDQNAMHVVADGDVRLAADGAGVRHRQLRLLPAGRHQSRCQRMELAGDRARRMAARAGPAEARRDDRRRRPAAHRIRGEGRHAPGGAARPGLGAAAGDGQGDPRRGSRAPAGLRRTRHRRDRTCARWSPTPISTTSPPAATFPASRSSTSRATSPPPAARWWSPAPGSRCTRRAPSPSGSATCST